MLDQEIPISPKVEDIFTRYNYIFLGRKKEIKRFLSKFEEKLFKNKKVSNVERIDSSDKLKLSGYHIKISSWRDPSGNPIISTCLEVEGKKRRYDYIFYLSKEIAESEEEIPNQIEKMPFPSNLTHSAPHVSAREREAIMEDVRAIYSDSFRLRQSFQFEQAIIKLDSMIDLLVERKLPEYVKKLEERRDYLKSAQEAFEQRKEELQDVDERAKILMQENVMLINQEQFKDSLRMINQTITELRQRHFPEYLSQLEQKKKELVEAQKIYEDMKKKIKEQEELFEQSFVDDEKIQDLKNLEKTVKLNKEFGQFEAAKVNLEKILKILEDLNRKDLIEKYALELEEIKVHFEYLEDN